MPHALPFPRRVSIELTNHCNQRCPACPRQGFSRPLGFFDPDLFAKLMVECARPGTTVWLHFLGEPLLHPGLLGMIRAAKDAGVGSLGLSTNAVSLHGALAEGILASGLDRLECSMDADDREGYERMRGRDHFERVRRNVRGFLGRKRELGLRLPVTSVQVLRTPEADRDLDAILDEWTPHLGESDFVMTIEPAAFAGAVEVAAIAAAPLVDQRRPCAWLYESVMVLQDGTVTMCGADWDATSPLGNVRESSLESIWNGEEMRRRRGLHDSGLWGRLSPCATCEDWRLAEGSGYRNASAERREAGRTAGAAVPRTPGEASAPGLSRSDARIDAGPAPR